jgi:hypothetical protein
MCRREVGEDGSEYESMSSEFETGDWNCGDTEAGIGDRNGELVMLNFAFFNFCLKPGKSFSEY